MASENAVESLNYVLLHPKKLHLIDLYHILFSENIHDRKFVECPEEKKKYLDHRFRCLVFFSGLAQMLLLHVEKPLKWFGSNTVDPALNWLNCLSGCKVKAGEKTLSPSTIGNLDTRVELDKKIKHEDIRYYPALSAMASKISYEDENFIRTTVTECWKMEVVEYYNFWDDFQEENSTQAFMLHDKNGKADMVVVAFRGTEPFNANDWCTDLDISWTKFSKTGKIHRGFMKALGLPKDHINRWPEEHKQVKQQQLAYYTIREKLREIMGKNESTKFIVTGHSLGGALAILFPAVLAMHHEDGLLKRLEGVYTFGQPRVGDRDFGKFMRKQLRKYRIDYLRFVYCNDVVPRLPADDSTLLYKHFGKCLYYNSFYKGKIVEEEPNRNYFSVLAWIPMHLNAIWELLRSFIMPYVCGEEYRESVPLKAFRVFGVIFPGLSAHCTQDYVNATRLGYPANLYPRH